MPINNEVQYTLSLRDLISKGIEGIEKKAQSLDKQLNTLVKGSIAAIGAYEIYEFAKGSVEAFGEAERASVKLDNQLQNSGRASDQLRKALDDQAESLMKVSLFDDDAITGAQGIIAGYKGISNELMNNSIPAIVDAASAMGVDLASAANAVGAALEDPEQGLRKLKGLNIILSEEQKEYVKSLTDAGKKQQAQAYLLDIIKDKYKGAGQAMAEAGTGPMVVLGNQLGNVKESIGELIVDIIQGLQPAIQVVGELMKSFTEFLTNNKTEIKAVAFGVALAAGAFAVYKVVTMASALATTIMTTSISSLTAAMLANPVGLFVAAIAAIGVVLYEAWERSETFRKGVLAVWEVVKTYVGMMIDYFKNLGTIVMGVFTFDASKIKEGLSNMVDLAKGAGEKFSKAWDKGKKEGATSWAASELEKKEGVIPKGGPTTQGPTGPPTAKVSEPKGATGNKATTINITINKLVENFSVSTTNVTESTSKIRELVATALTDALNDSQIIAGV